MSTTAELVAAINALTDRIARLEKAAKKPPRRAWRVREVADMTGIHYLHVLAMCRDGRLAFIKDGQQYVIPNAEVDRLLAEADTAATA